MHRQQEQRCSGRAAGSPPYSRVPRYSRASSVADVDVGHRSPVGLHPRARHDISKDVNGGRPPRAHEVRRPWTSAQHDKQSPSYAFRGERRDEHQRRSPAQPINRPPSEPYTRRPVAPPEPLHLHEVRRNDAPHHHEPTRRPKPSHTQEPVRRLEHTTPQQYDSRRAAAPPRAVWRSPPEAPLRQRDEVSIRRPQRRPREGVAAEDDAMLKRQRHASTWVFRRDDHRGRHRDDDDDRYRPVRRDDEDKYRHTRSDNGDRYRSARLDDEGRYRQRRHHPTTDESPTMRDPGPSRREHESIPIPEPLPAPLPAPPLSSLPSPPPAPTPDPPPAASHLPPPDPLYLRRLQLQAEETQLRFTTFRLHLKHEKLQRTLAAHDQAIRD